MMSATSSSMHDEIRPRLRAGFRGQPAMPRMRIGYAGQILVEELVIQSSVSCIHEFEADLDDNCRHRDEQSEQGGRHADGRIVQYNIRSTPE